jgi:nicotinamidase-related amidase/glutathione S-transferase/alkylated DNA repair dioxygenase AlkB
MHPLTNLVSQNQPVFQTHQALLVIGLQNDFVLPTGRLPVSNKNSFLDGIQTLVPKFRELNGNVIWVQTLYEANRVATDADTGAGDALVVGGLIDGEESGAEGGDEELAKLTATLPEQSFSSKGKQRAREILKNFSASRRKAAKQAAKAPIEETDEADEELFLLKSEKRAPACIPDSHGAAFADAITDQIQRPADMVIRTSHYSAFQGTNLLMTLRARLVTELYICGAITNVSVLATVIDAARHGVKINVVEDCLGFRKQTRHDLALKRMEEFFDAYMVESSDALAPKPPKTEALSQKGGDGGIESLMGNMSLGDNGQAERSDKEFADMLVKGAAVPCVQEKPDEQEKPKLVKTKIRMRTGRTGKARKKKKEKEREEKDLQDGSETAPAPDGTITPASHGEVESAAPAEPATVTPSVNPAQTQTEPRRPSGIAKAESVADLREKESSQRTLKNVASVPVLNAKSGGEGKERSRLSDFSDRVRMSLSRAPKSQSSSDSKRASTSSLKAPSISSLKEEDEQATEPPSEVPNPVTTPQQDQSQAKVVENEPSPATTTSTTTSTNPVKSAAVGKSSKVQSLANLPVLGPEDRIAEGDSRIINDFFPADFHYPTDPFQPLKDLIFTQLYNEVRWQKMLHQQGEVPRLVCCQGAFGDDGSMPVYRHPADQTLPLLHFSPKVQVIRKQAEKLVSHPLNHVLIQLYRSGNDFISEHSDKTLDIVKGSSIVNVSFGSQRTMRLRTKKPQTGDTTGHQRETQRVHMPHNSMFVLGLKSNEKWLHGIMPDKRISAERSESETDFGGIRISLTFRHIGTFLDARESTIWGQGATAKEQREAADVVNGDEAEAERMIRAFSRENHHPEFNWDEWYDDGFDILHLHDPPEDVPLLFASNNEVENNQVMIALAECKVKYTLIDAPVLEKEYEADRQISFRDDDVHHTEVHTSSAILLYLDRYHPLDSSPSSNDVTASAYNIIHLGNTLLKTFQSEPSSLELKAILATLEDQLETHSGPFIAGRRFSIADCFVWPVIDTLVEEWSDWDEQSWPKLAEWYRAVWRKKACVKKVRDKLPEVKNMNTSG